MAELATKIARIGMDIAVDAPPLAPSEPAIDRAHLARMTHGERNLEREVLQLYATQADMLLARMAQSSPAAVGALAEAASFWTEAADLAPPGPDAEAYRQRARAALEAAPAGTSAASILPSPMT